jgi:16S rRNA (guanine527-N7)-methyltransferase
MDKMFEFIRLFEEYNAHTNLMSQKEVQKLSEKHIPDSLAISNFFEKYTMPKTILDIGTGGGLPAIPISLKYRQINVYALDSIAKKIKFITEVKEKLEIDNLYPICSRIEEFRKREYFDVVISRAVAALPSLLEYATPYAKIGGYIVAYKSKAAEEEISEAQKAMKVLNVKYIDKIDVSGMREEERYLLVFQKTKKTDKKYPRDNNLVRKNPL